MLLQLVVLVLLVGVLPLLLLVLLVLVPLGMLLVLGGVLLVVLLVDCCRRGSRRSRPRMQTMTAASWTTRGPLWTARTAAERLENPPKTIGFVSESAPGGP